MLTGYYLCLLDKDNAILFKHPNKFFIFVAWI